MSDDSDKSSSSLEDVNHARGDITPPFDGENEQDEEPLAEEDELADDDDIGDSTEEGDGNTDSDDESDDEDEPIAGSSRENPFFSSRKRGWSNDTIYYDSDDSDSIVPPSNAVASKPRNMRCSECSSSDESTDTSFEEMFKPLIDDEDPLIKALKKSKETAERDKPADIESGVQIMDISFHPAANFIAHSTMTGFLLLSAVTNEENSLKHKLKAHKGDVRSIEFDSTGENLVTGGKDKSFQIVDTETWKVKFTASGCHASPLYKVKPLSEHLVATGDEDGTVRLWDNRQSAMSKPVMDISHFDDAVTDFFYDAVVDPKYMVASSAQGVIASFNLPGKKLDMTSEMYEGEMNTMGVIKRNSKLVVGCGDGRLYMFHWRQFGYHGAEFPGHPDIVNSLIPVTDNIVLTACEDGVIRAIHLYPHRFVGTVGHHEDNLPVERLDVSSSGELLASISHDNKIKFWNIRYLEHMEYEKTPKPYHNQKTKIRRKDSRMQKAKEKEFQLPSSNRQNRKDFFRGLDDDQ